MVQTDSQKFEKSVFMFYWVQQGSVKICGVPWSAERLFQGREIL